MAYLVVHSVGCIVRISEPFDKLRVSGIRRLKTRASAPFALTLSLSKGRNDPTDIVLFNRIPQNGKAQ
jgi:hypothetical protein